MINIVDNFSFLFVLIFKWQLWKPVSENWIFQFCKDKIWYRLAKHISKIHGWDFAHSFFHTIEWMSSGIMECLLLTEHEKSLIIQIRIFKWSFFKFFNWMKRKDIMFSISSFIVLSKGFKISLNLLNYSV